jgi:cell division protein FtsA
MTTFATIDIGSSYIRCFIASSQHTNNTLSILGHAFEPAQGISRGIIVDIQKAKLSINNAFSRAEQQCNNLSIDRLWVSVNSELSTHEIQSSISIPSGKISQDNIQQVEQKAYESFKNDPNTQNLQVAAQFPHSYYTDNTSVPLFSPPIDLAAGALSFSTKIITISLHSYNNIVSCLPRHIPITTIPAPYAASLFCIPPSVKQHGCVLIDIGAQCSSYWLLHEGKFLHTGSLHIGNDDISKDISQYFTLSLQEAERLKISHGHASSTAEHDTTSISSCNLLNEYHDISKGRLIDIISAKLDDIFSSIFEQLEQYNLVELAHYFILTGKITLLPGLAARAEIQFSKLKQEYYQLQIPNASSDSTAQQQLRNHPNIRVDIAYPLHSLERPLSQNHNLLDICPNASEYQLLNPENHVAAGLLLLGHHHPASQLSNNILNPQKKLAQLIKKIIHV